MTMVTRYTVREGCWNCRNVVQIVNESDPSGQYVRCFCATEKSHREDVEPTGFCPEYERDNS